MWWFYALTFFPFCGLDYLLTLCNIGSPYYLLHTLHNIGIMYLTYEDVEHTLTNFHSLESYEVNTNAATLVVAFHLYHVVMYRNKLKYDDILHHVLMIAFAIPIGLLASSTTPLMGYSLFFATGLPGAISYFSLFLQRNDLIQRMTEKIINTWINVWIRAPGCVSHATLTLVWIFSSESDDNWRKLAGILPAILMYWNGQYFMRQAVEDYGKRMLEEEYNSI
jgi:hypothetical protein